MSDVIALPTALQVLERRLRGVSEPEDILQALRALQRLGLTREELSVLIERVRAVNEVTNDDEQVEDNCLIALEIASGINTLFGLKWEASEITRVHLPRAIDRSTLEAALPYALKSNDLLPPREELSSNAELSHQLTTGLHSRIQTYGSSIEHADFYRVPKTGFTTRPASLLAIDDRVAYEALAERIAAELDATLENQVVWPRGRGIPDAAYEEYAQAPNDWDSRYVVIADIESYYESISHSLLVLFVESSLTVSRSYLHALEGLLRVVMGSDVGLPQGPNASEIFGTLFLAPIDRVISSEGWAYVRFADDFLIGANSIADGRRKIATLESHLREIGLRLNSAKTKLMRKSTYVRGLDHQYGRAEEFRVKFLMETSMEFMGAEEVQRVSESLAQVGTDIDDLIYGATVTLEDIIERVRTGLTPELTEIYYRYFVQLSQLLASDELPDDMQSIERNIKECLTYLAAAERVVDDEQLIQRSLLWFPGLSENVARYLGAIAERSPSIVRRFVTTWLDFPSDLDWTTAWMCHVFTGNPRLVDNTVTRALERVTITDVHGGLTKAEAIRALANSRRLSEEVWQQALKSVTPALRSELLLAAFAQPHLYRPLQATLGAQDDPE